MSHPLGDIECFWVEPAPVRRNLYTRWCGYWRGEGSNIGCKLLDAGCRIHCADILLGDEPMESTVTVDLGDGTVRRVGSSSREATPEERAAHPWPDRCECGKAEIRWEQLWVAPATGEMRPLERWGAGAMFEAWWMDYPAWHGPDGICLIVRTPAGDWHPDHAKQKWSRTGDPRKPETLSISPSILFPTEIFHAHLVAGKLVRTPDSTV